MVNVKKATESIAKLAILKFFPSEPAAKLALVGLICEIAETNEQIDWLVSRMLVLYNEWPGPKELRACYCSRHKPKDGIEARSTVFLDGIPSEKKPEPILALPEGSFSADHQISNAIKLLARSKSMDRPRRLPAPRVPDVTVNASYVPVTQVDIDREVQKLRDARAREEAGL